MVFRSWQGSRAARSVPVVATLALASAALMGCSGQEDRPMAQVAPASAGLLPMSIVSPLVADDGSLLPTAQAPADPAAQTRTQRYANAEQAEQLLRTLGEHSLLVEVPDGSAESVAQALSAVERALSTAVGTDISVLLRGPNPRALAVVADRLAEADVPRVWVVVS